MTNSELERVQTDLATMKIACAEPALPSEELATNIVIAIFGLLVAATTWFVPVWVVQVMFTAFAVVGFCIYIPWKKRILKSDPAGRGMERKEVMVYGLSALGCVIYVCFHRFLSYGAAKYDFKVWQQDVAAIMFFMGTGFIANSLLHSTRRSYLPWGVASIVSGLMFPYAQSFAATTAIIGVALAIGGIGAAVVLVLSRRADRGLNERN